MISKGYEEALFESPLLNRYALKSVPSTEDDHNDPRVLTTEFNLVRDLRYAALLVRRVAGCKETLFSVSPRRHRGNMLGIDATPLGVRLISLMPLTQDTFEQHFPQHGFNPYVSLLFKAQKVVPAELEVSDWWRRAAGDEAVQVCEQLNAFAAYLRTESGRPQFLARLDSLRRCCDKNTTGARRYINAIFKHRGARQLVLRLELGYAMEEAWSAARPTQVTLEQAKQDLVKFQRYVRDRQPYTGFLAKLEYGLLRGYHFHVLVFLNGHVRQQHVLIAKWLGEHWAKVICEGQGRYWNCNPRCYRFPGIGVINYNDGDLRIALLERVASYLTETDFWLDFKPGGRTFFKGRMPQPAPQRGRPRQYDDQG